MRARCGESGKHDGECGRLADWSCCSPLSLAQRIMVARGCVGGPGCAQSCWKWIRTRASLLASSALVFASAGSRGQTWLGAREACGPVVLLSVLTGAVHTGGAWVRGWSRSHAICWKWIRARASLLANSAHVFASAGSRGKHGGVHGRPQTGLAALRSHWPSACYGGAWVRGWSRSRAKLLEVDPSARVLAGK